MKEKIYECCRELRLSATFADNAAETSGETHQEYLLKVLRAEIDYRNSKRRNLYIKQACFDNLKTFENYDFDRIKAISIEARQKLTKIRPTTVAQASRISGVSPSDISVLLIHMGR